MPRTFRSSTFAVRRGVARRKSVWLQIDHSQSQLVGDNSVGIINSLNAAALALLPFTVVRTRGLLTMVSDQIVGSETPAASFGIAVVSDQAVAIGVTAVPTPVTDRASDLFFVYEDMASDYQFQSAVGFGNTSVQYRVDSKAMRKVDIGQNVVVVIESDTAAGSLVTFVGRMLVKLH